MSPAASAAGPRIMVNGVSRALQEEEVGNRDLQNRT